MKNLPTHCPKCDGAIDGLEAMPWGTATNTYHPALPFICASCGSFLVIVLEDGELLEPGPAEIALVKRNVALWKAITDAQARIRALPDRLPVLR